MEMIFYLYLLKRGIYCGNCRHIGGGGGGGAKNKTKILLDEVMRLIQSIQNNGNPQLIFMVSGDYE